MKTDFLSIVKYLRNNKSEFTCLEHSFAEKVPTIKEIIECELNSIRFTHKQTGLRITVERSKKEDIYSAYLFLWYPSDLGNVVTFGNVLVSKTTTDTPESIIRGYIDGAKLQIKDRLTKIIATAKEEIKKFK